MILDKTNITAYLKYLFPDRPDAFIDEISVRWTKEVEAEKRELSTHFIHKDSSGKIIVALRTESALDKDYRIILPTTVINSKSICSDSLTNLVKEAISILKEKGEAKIRFRVVENESLSFLSVELPQLGFSLRSSRVEYKSKVCDLPGDKNSPFTWVNVSEGTKYDLNYAAMILEKAGDGNPEWGNLEQNVDVLSEYLSDTEFISDPKNLQIGFIGTTAAGIVLTQVAEKEGWSTLAYMGLLPEYRGTGLGQWLHRKGFDVMRDLGGVTYHGGTDSNNKAMRALFRKHECEEFRSMQEWELEIN